MILLKVLLICEWMNVDYFYLNRVVVICSIFWYWKWNLVDNKKLNFFWGFDCEN